MFARDDDRIREAHSRGFDRHSDSARTKRGRLEHLVGKALNTAVFPAQRRVQERPDAQAAARKASTKPFHSPSSAPLANGK